MNIICKTFVVIVALAPFLARAGGDEVVVIYNKKFPESKAVADYYAAKRNVPASQIFGFNLTTNEEMSRMEFRDDLQLPLAKKLEADELWKFGKVTLPSTNGQTHIIRAVIKSKIRYAVLCYGVPLKIASDSTLAEIIEDKLRPEFQRNEASVDSELAWLPMIDANLKLSGPMLNWIFAATNTAPLNPTNGILLVARLDGPTADIARGLVDKALEAEHDGLWGRGYFDARGLTPTNDYFAGDQRILKAAEVWQRFGFETVVDEKPETFSTDFPMSQIAVYCGWYDGNVSGPFTLPHVEFMPGAFAYHLHSFSAATIRDANQNWVGPLLAKGATCTMGCVYEPYLAFTPAVAVFLSRFTFEKFTFGEAAWAAQPALSWQTTVVGDPLYRPFAKPPKILHNELIARHSPLAEWSFVRMANTGIMNGTPLEQVTEFLENISMATNSAVLQQKLSDIYAAEGKMDSAIAARQKALQLNPSPEQRIQLRLTLAEIFLKRNQIAEARTDYQQLLAEAPDYPGRRNIEQKISQLKQQISDTRATAIQSFAATNNVPFGTNGFGSISHWTGFGHVSN